MNKKRTIIKVEIPLNNILDDVPYKISKETRMTLINKPIIKDEIPIGIITEVDVDKDIAIGCIWSNVNLESRLKGEDVIESLDSMMCSFGIQNKNESK